MNKIKEFNISKYSEDAYLMYSRSVILERAIASVKDGQKPVHRRILFAMKVLGLLTDKNPKKSARIVGDIIGKYHPHGDTAVYDTLVRMSQSFSMRYPLIKGQGNFGSIDGDPAAAMRYTEAQFEPIAELLLSELNLNSAIFKDNYDKTDIEPEILPSRLNFLLLNGSFGIAVGLGSNIPSHNIQNLSDATTHVLKNPDCSVEDVVEKLQAPDFPTGGILINSKDDIIKSYKSGKGSFTIRCKWKTESLPRNKYKIVIYELPPNTSPQEVVERISSLERPKVSGDKKLSKKQTQEKNFITSVISLYRDESTDEDGIRIVLEPRNYKDSPEEVMKNLYKLINLEKNFNMNLNVISLDNFVRKRNIKELIDEWIEFRFETVTRRTKHLYDEASKKIHILEGKKIAYENIKDVIDIIQNSEDPKLSLMEKYNLSEIQSDYILDMKLRNLIKLELNKTINDLESTRKEFDKLRSLLDSNVKMKNLIIKEIESDTLRFKDERKTELKEMEKSVVSREEIVVNEKITAIITEQGWVTYRKGHDLDLSTISLKDGDNIFKSIEMNTVDNLCLLSNYGRVFNIKVFSLDGGKNMNHINTLIDFESGDSYVDFISISDNNKKYLISSSSGYGFIVESENLLTKNKKGKIFLSGVKDSKIFNFKEINDENYIICKSSDNRYLSFPLSDMTVLGKGKGVKIMQLPKSAILEDIKLHKDLDLKIIKNNKDITLNIEKEGILGSRARRGKMIKGDITL